MSGRKRVAILGSTGSIGTQALDVIANHPDRFSVVGLAAGRNLALLEEQRERFKPQVATSAADGSAGLLRVAVETQPDIVLAATDGAVAFDAVLAAIERGIDIAVANKELIVAAGEVMLAAAAQSGSKLLPVDSEHSALFQCLVGEDAARVAAIGLTASGGPFRTASAAEMAEATLEHALAHPTWRMGTKNTIDSATMMNKGLEVIEASRLFDQPGERVLIAVHPQSIAHGFVLFTDGSVKAQLCAPDMRIPIGYALSYPDRLSRPQAQAAGEPPRAGDPLEALGAKPGASQLRYEFEPPDFERFPCLRLAYQALARGGTAPAVLSAANEVAVRSFVEGKVRFGEIARIIETTLERVAHRDATLAYIREADSDARLAAAEYVEDIRCT
ncbi:MAG TPA: 1-deoxy-D-xylulose-5-phosphate reductoisomerase [Candidatus Acidoferrales bacterium]|nr:1-deoxy-D-xylulose-5-phosphate reductoisomerase [Candidatus Acidoferrales bacterium]